MEDVLEVYHRPYDDKRPLVCIDEASKQLVGETVQPLPAEPGQPQRFDYEYVRNGTANLFMISEPLLGWRAVQVTDRRTAKDFAEVLRWLVEDVHAEADGSFVVNASTTIRALNRSMRWKLPTDGPKTLNGLLIEFLETIPEPGTALKLADYTLEVLQTADNAIKTVRVRPPPPAPLPGPAKPRRRPKAR